MEPDFTPESFVKELLQFTTMIKDHLGDDCKSFTESEIEDLDKMIQEKTRLWINTDTEKVGREIVERVSQDDLVDLTVDRFCLALDSLMQAVQDHLIEDCVCPEKFLERCAAITNVATQTNAHLF